MTEEAINRALTEQSEEFKAKLKKKFCFRMEEPLVNLKSPLAQVVIGVRRSGKSTLCLNVLKNSGVKFAYVNFDDERLSVLQTEDLNTVLEQLYKIYGNFDVLFVDEMQNISDWYIFINRLLRQEMHVLITGSNAKLLGGELATHLTGRYIQTELFPFSFSEYCDFKNVEKKFDTTKSSAFLQKAFDDYLKDGGFPELFFEKRKLSYINSLVDNIIKNDIEKRYAIRYKSSFEQMASHLLNNAPSKINYKDLQNLFGLRSDHTAENYVSFLKNAYLIQGLHKYSAKSKIRVRDEKAYAVDVALMNNRENAFAGENLGLRLETIVYIELLRRYRPYDCDVYYYEETAGECDFVVCRGKNVIKLVQVSYSISNHKTLKRELRGLSLAQKATGCTDMLLITYNEAVHISQNGVDVMAVPAFQWLCSEREEVAW